MCRACVGFEEAAGTPRVRNERSKARMKETRGTTRRTEISRRDRGPAELDAVKTGRP